MAIFNSYVKLPEGSWDAALSSQRWFHICWRKKPCGFSQQYPWSTVEINLNDLKCTIEPTGACIVLSTVILHISTFQLNWIPGYTSSNSQMKELIMAIISAKILLLDDKNYIRSCQICWLSFIIQYIWPLSSTHIRVYMVIYIHIHNHIYIYSNPKKDRHVFRGW